MNKVVNRYLSEKITNRLRAQNIIQESEIPVYFYGFELLLSSVFNAIWILIWGCILQREMLALIYIIILATVRTQIGGYHANSYRNCFICYSIAFLTVVMMEYGCKVFALPAPFLGISAIVILLVEYFMAPVLHTKKLNTQERLIARKKGIGRTTLWLIAMLLLYFYNKEWSYAIFCVLTLCVGLMILEKYLQKRTKKCQEKK